MDNKIKSGLFIGVLLFLWLPFIQLKTHFFKDKKLNGVTVPSAKEFFSTQGWLTESYQQNYEQFTAQEFGFRASLVRLSHELSYQLYGEAKAHALVLGKNDYVFNYDYLNAYLGVDFVGDEQIKDRTQKLILIQDTLIKLGKNICVVLAPGKASHCAEYIPNDYLKTKRSKNNYDGYVEAFKQAHVEYLDFSKWFKTIKKTAKYPLYPKAGFHWSYYGEYLATDSLLKYISKKHNVNGVKIVLDSINVNEYNNDYEYEAGLLLNMYSRLNTYPLATPHTHFDTVAKTQIKTLVVADSYYNKIWANGLSANAFDKGEYWYYYKHMLTYDTLVSHYRNDILLIDEINKYQSIIILSSDVNLNNFGFDFIDDLYDLYYDVGYIVKQKRKKRVQQIITNIKGTPEWLKSITEKAQAEGINVETAVLNNAEYVVSEEDKKAVK